LIIITFLLLIILLMFLRHKQQDRYLMELLEKQVKERTAQLEAANKELESFSYTVSHSLRAPLRHIDGFCQVLLEDYADKLDEEGVYQLRRLQTCSQEMANLIDDIQHFSRITREKIKIEPVNLSNLVYAAAESMKRFEPERNVAFAVEEGVVAHGDKRLLRVVIEELIGNAWKFSSKKEYVSITFGMKEYINKMTVYFVRDNGAGFDMAYVDKLFKPLGRLHHTHEFEGNGFGLATVSKIIHRHGGLIWGEGVVDEGATFYFVI